MESHNRKYKMKLDKFKQKMMKISDSCAKIYELSLNVIS